MYLNLQKTTTLYLHTYIDKFVVHFPVSLVVLKSLKYKIAGIQNINGFELRKRQFYNDSVLM